MTGLVLADVAWWAPVAIVGGAAAGAGVGYLLFIAGAPPRTGETSKTDWERTDKTSYPSWNPAAFVMALAAIGLIAGLAVGLSSG